MTETEVKARLEAFCANNPESRVTLEEQDIVVKEPWSDDTLELRFNFKARQVLDALNILRLPPFLSAIWHSDTQDLEFIFIPTKSELHGRSFSFTYEGRAYRCEFGDCSERLFRIAEAAKPIAPPSHTDHRNLSIFDLLRSLPTKAPKTAGTSFWVRGIEWEPNSILQLVRNLNFYMWYFDRHTPRIRIHEQCRIEMLDRTPRYLYETFPGEILARRLDPFMLQLWESFVVGNPFQRFLYGYQVVEYVSYYYLQEGTTKMIRRALASPEINVRSREVARQIMDAVAEDKLEDAVKVEKAIEAYVDPNNLAASICRDLPYFSSDQTFDGGFTIPATCGPNWTPKEKRECKEMARKIANTMRRIRNAIVHARETRNQNSIVPTLANQERLFPWLAPLSVVISELLLYQDVE